jgi:CBS domain containing-hemolysin-like protein
MVATASREGAISEEESRMFGNLLRAEEIHVGDVMTPRPVVFTLPVENTVGHLIAESRTTKPFSRIPLYRDDPDNIVGYVLLDDVLRHAAERGDRNRPLLDFRREIAFIPELATVGSAMKQVLQRGEHIAMVTDERGSIVGLVTLEDLTETLLGAEIVDESDHVADLREAAARLRDHRLERLRQKQQLMVGALGKGNAQG